MIVIKKWLQACGPSLALDPVTGLHCYYVYLWMDPVATYLLPFSPESHHQPPLHCVPMANPCSHTSAHWQPRPPKLLSGLDSVLIHVTSLHCHM